MKCITVFWCCFAVYVDAGPITYSKPSVVAAVRGEVTLPCRIDGDLGHATLSWKRIIYDTDTSQIRIYHSTFASKPDESKYVVSAYSLTIKKLEFNDGGYYKCSFESTTSDVKQTAVVVVGAYIGATIIGAFKVHVVNRLTCSNFPMFRYTFQVYLCVVACILWCGNWGRAGLTHCDFIGDRHSSVHLVYLCYGEYGKIFP